MNGMLLNLIEIWLFSTAFVDYIFIEFFVAYASFMNIIKEKIYTNKFFIKGKINSIYEDLLMNF